MATTVADQVFGRVQALMAEAGVATRAEAIRRVASEMDRSVSATSSAYYTGARRARAAGAGMAPPEPAATARTRRGRGAGGGSGTPALYAQMQPLVEAGATIEQAARRFGDEEAVPEIAAGYARWAEREGGDGDRRAGDPGGDLAGALERIRTLEAENHDLRQDLTRARRVISRARAILDTAIE